MTNMTFTVRELLATLNQYIKDGKITDQTRVLLYDEEHSNGAETHWRPMRMITTIGNRTDTVMLD